MLNALVPLRAAGIFGRIAKGMGRALAEQSTDDAAARELLVEAYLASYSTSDQVASIRRENRLADTSTAEVRHIRSGTKPPAVRMRMLTAGRGKAPALQKAYDALTAATADAWPVSELIRVQDSGHYIHHDRPDLVVEAVAAISR